MGLNGATTAPPRGALVSLPVGVVLALAGGLMLAAAFPPIDFGPSAPVGVALLSAALWRTRARRGVGLGLLAGLAFFLPLLSWMTVIGTDAWLMLSLWCAAWFMLLGAGTAVTSRLPLAPVWIAALWVLIEGLRGRIPWGGFPWGSLSFSQANTDVGAAAAVGGTALVSFAVALAGACLISFAVALSEGRWRRALGAATTIAAVLVLPGWLAPSATPPASGQQASVAIVQGGTPQSGMGAMDVRRAVLDNHVAQTLDLAAAIDRGEEVRPDFVLWPENSSDLDPFGDPQVALDITAAARAVGVPILVGAVTTVPDDPNLVWNVGIVWDPVTGPSQMYVKTHPVPFGEYIPFREQLAPLIGRFDRIPRDFAAGDLPGNLDIAGIDVGAVICFEIAYTDVVAQVVNGGAGLIAVQTNNATYGETAQPEQQLAIERMQATHTGRTVLVAATSGISAVITPDRAVTATMGMGEQGWMLATVDLVDEPTWGVTVGPALELTLGLLAALGIILSVVERRRHGSHRGSDAVDEIA